MYLKDLTNTVKKMYATINYAEKLKQKVVLLKQTALNTSGATKELMQKIQNAEKNVNALMFKLEGVSPKASYEEIPPHKLPIEVRLQDLAWVHYQSTAPVTKTEKDQLNIVKEELPAIITEMKKLATQTIPEIEKALDDIGAPWTPGRMPK